MNPEVMHQHIISSLYDFDDKIEITDLTHMKGATSLLEINDCIISIYSVSYYIESGESTCEILTIPACSSSSSRGRHRRYNYFTRPSEFLRAALVRPVFPGSGVRPPQSACEFAGR